MKGDRIMKSSTMDGVSTVNTKQTSDSSNGRKIRMVLQKKQLDVLLQTYSNVLDDTVLPGASTEDYQQQSHNNHKSPSTGYNPEVDRWTIARKSSIEGNTFSRSTSRWEMSMDETDGDADLVDTYDEDDEQRMAAPEGIHQLRENRSLISESEVDTDMEDHDEEEYQEYFDQNHGYQPAYGADASTAAQKPRKSRTSKSSSSSKQRSVGTANITNGTKERVDFSTRLSQAGQVLREFTSKTTQKHQEIADDFQEATLKLRTHLKSGADILFEDMSEHFDEVVRNLFVVDGEQRDDADRTNVQARTMGSNAGRRDRGSSGTRQNNNDRNVDPDFHPLTHEETLRAMNQQVVDLLHPVEQTVQTYSKQLVTCVAPFPEEYDNDSPVRHQECIENSRNTTTSRSRSTTTPMRRVPSSRGVEMVVTSQARF